MSQIAFYWGPINAVHNIGFTLWIGGIFYYIFGLQSCLSLLDPTQKTSLQLQSLRKLFQFNWIFGVITLVTQAALLFRNSYDIHSITWSSWAALGLVIVMIILQFSVFTSAYRKARRALRPKPEIFRNINNPLKLIIFLGVISLVLLAF
ncbi:hypothetical protein [Commensalibacter nepenthis]|uniref:Copper resistance protein D domain-containing protein n=1 Tax=Commensalibacter nepenthis TaxID=3043872 RepID=A0ABT6Q9B0_9PROT|nr:hypothetical protein [Commensalibacter sp. TBRC 10068]MDI2113495.1 hypothetical protein [Commensalibacter sp. TBRC 10068]